MTTFRKKLGMTRAEMARVTEIGYVTLSNIENGYVLSITKSVQNKLATIGASADLPRAIPALESQLQKRNITIRRNRKPATGIIIIICQQNMY